MSEQLYVKPTILQTETHPYSQENKLKEFLAKEEIVIQEPIFSKLAEKYGKSNAQIILRWHVQAMW